MHRVLAIEDQALGRDAVAPRLAQSGFDVEVARTGREGIALALSGQYDAVTIERRLPDLDGLAIVTTIRSVGLDTPIVLLSSSQAVEERVQGLRAGCDDYLSRPFVPEEMLARVEAILRRYRHTSAPETVLRVPPLELDLVRHTLVSNGKLLKLRPAEMSLIEYLMRHPRMVLTRTMIYESVWGGRYDPTSNVVDVHIGRLRSRIDVPGTPSLIRTVRGTGYLLG
ncbi:response regulator transcription factor [Paraburkholderia acidipaludis]|uniref:response regulator transcription factor n=1 Tax=Paraburkholderia acidipaludis TaxID=660537 RepID=UPI000484E55D|nr:response regulator transcription factor [Paraburkholderia acidipaludis]